MDVVIIEVYKVYNEFGDMTVSDIENVYGIYNTDTMNINDKIIELENLRTSYNTSFEIMPLIKKTGKG